MPETPALDAERLAPWLPALRPPPGDGPVLAACSGGTDSLALVALLAAAGRPVIAAHVDHGLRPGSGAEAQGVEEACRAVGVSGFEALSVEVGAGSNLEERARDARHAALGEAAGRLGCEWVALGHTRDDQAETVLLNLLRGSGRAGLGGMPRLRAPFARPILDLSRSETEAVCAAAGLEPLHDPMNDDRRLRRVWLRHELLPLLEQGAGRDLRAVLARQADLLRDESDFLDALARQELAAAGSEPGGDLEARSVASLPDALARRVVRVWLGAPPPSAAEVERVLEVARLEARGTELAGGVRVERSGGVLRVTRRLP